MKARIATGLLVVGVALLAGTAGIVLLLFGGGAIAGLWAVVQRVGPARKHVTSSSATVTERHSGVPSVPARPIRL